ncbi:MAG: GNAT family N-acetyltransferase [Roseateles sp.]|uniref:GNAT family N-acetyltransferase n=1 Tax=Roseateles sp. TaxID=1971397 RepID=UPI0039ECDEB1
MLHFSTTTEDIVTTIQVGTQEFFLSVMTQADTPREQLNSEAANIYHIFAEREREFGFGPNVAVEYPPIIEQQTDDFLTDPVGYIATRVGEFRKSRPISQIVVLTTYGQQLLGPLSSAGYTPVKIDMPAGPDHTYAFTLARDAQAAGACSLYLEAVDEADEKIRPTFVLKLVDGNGRLCGGACGSVHERDGKRFAYLAMLSLVQGLPPTTGTRLAEAMFEALRGQGVSAIHLGTQTAGRFYEKLGFRVTHRLVKGLRTRLSGSGGEHLSDDLVMMSIDLSNVNTMVTPNFIVGS